MRAMSLGHLKWVFSRNGWKILETGQLKCVSYGIVCHMFYCVDGEKALIREDNSQERELHRLVVKTHSRRF